MAESAKARTLKMALTGAALVNAFMISSAWFARPDGPQPIYVRIADAFAAPPGYVAMKLNHPSQHTVSAYITALVLSLACSFLFYAAVCWILIRAVMMLRSRRMQQSQPGPLD